MCILHPNLREIILTSDKNEKPNENILTRFAISPLTTSINSITIQNFKSLKLLDIFSPNIEKIHIHDCADLRKIELTQSESVKEFFVRGMELD